MIKKSTNHTAYFDRVEDGGETKKDGILKDMIFKKWYFKRHDILNH